MASQLGADLQVVAHDLFSESTTQQHKLGERATTGDGRVFRYSKVGASALVVGNLLQGPAEVTNHQNLTPAAAAIGATTITATLGATAATANQYAEGWAVITVTPGLGYQYRIKSHPAADASASLTVTLDDPIEVALTTSSRVDLVLNPYSGVIQCPTTLTGAPVGVAVNNIAASSFGWIQTGGVANVLADGANVVGSNVVASNGTAGAVEDAASPGAQPLVGTCVTGAADTECGAVKLILGD